MTSVEIKAESEEEAGKEGARRLDVCPAEVTVEPVGDSSYRVSLKPRPGRFEVDVPADGMSAVIRLLTPPVGEGDPISAEEVLYKLAMEDVSFGIDKEAIERVVSEVISTATQRKNVVIASGRRPEDGRDATIEFKVGKDAANKDPLACTIVRPQQVIAIKTPATRGKPGMNVFGEEIPAREGRDLDFRAGENVEVSKDHHKFLAKIYGQAETRINGIHIKSLAQVSRDGMSAQIGIFPSISDNSVITLDDVQAALAHAGVVHGIKQDPIEAAIRAGKPVKDLTVAESTPPQHGVDARVAYKFLLNGKGPEIIDAQRGKSALDERTILKEIVSAGAVLAIKTPPQPHKDGQTVTGKVLPGNPPKDKGLVAGENVVLLDDGKTYVVKEGAMGYANLLNGVLCVEDPITVTEDGLRVLLCIHPPSGSGRMLSRDDLAKALKDRGIIHGIDEAAMEKALKQAPKLTKPLYDVLLAKGNAPQKGDDARIEFEFQPGIAPGTLIEGTDRMDYRERGVLHRVNVGDILAHITPAGPGKDGMDVFGERIQAEPGRDRKLVPAANVGISEDGLTFTAETNGVVTLIGKDRIAVFKHYEITGDVDYSTGNVDMDGSLHIHGWVRSGFRVRASGDISVGKGVEDATVEAGASLKVHGGIIGEDKMPISAAVDVEAAFVENARVRAGGNVVVRDAVLRSSVAARGHLDIIQGKGHVIGGSVFGLQGAAIGEIGSDKGVETMVSVGPNVRARRLAEEAQKKMMSLQRHAAKINISLARLSKKASQGRLSIEEARKLAKLRKFKREAFHLSERKALYKRILEKTPDSDEDAPVSIDIARCAHEGTVVRVKGYVFEVRDLIEGKGRFVLNEDNQTVEFVRG